MNYRRIGRWAAAAGAVAVTGAGLYWLRERRTEQPDYVGVTRDGAFEIRRYPPMLTAATVQPGRRDQALGRGFGVLASYIFAEKREGDELAMTVPVLSERIGGRGWQVRFVMPKAHTAATLPPVGDAIAIETLPARRVAVVRFGGRADDAMLAAKEAELRAWVGAQGLTPTGAAEHAFYNSPFIPGVLRHNEVWLAV